jgi:uncharacterized membrane protein YgdD (TMEM256/DUF423 family)
VSSGWLSTASVAATIAVALGAFGAHGLRSRLTPDLLAIFETGVRYHMYHALALVGVSVAVAQWRESIWPAAAGWLFVAGIVVFSGSLYLLALSGQRWLGAITPLGGVAFLLGWMTLAIGALQRR